MIQPDHKPYKFALQLALIVAPVLLLTDMALYSLRQDRAAIEQDARDRAQTLASTLCSQMAEILTEERRAIPCLLLADKRNKLLFRNPFGIETVLDSDNGLSAK